MKKILNIILVFTITFCSVLLLSSCGKKDDPPTPYTPNLSKTFTLNGFTIKTTSDFNLQQTTTGIKLKSTGDNEISFGDTYIFAQYDIGNASYDFKTTSLEKYASDIAKIEGKTLSTPVKTITITERLNEIFTGDLKLNMYIVDEMQNPNGNWDMYSILCIGKGSNAFVYFNIYTSIQNKYYNDNITKLFAIVESTEIMTPIQATYTDSVKSNISTTMVRTDDFMSYFNFEFSVPDNYIAYEIPEYPSGNHLAKNNYPDNTWSSSIRCSNLASFMGNAILDDGGVKHLINFSTNNHLGFYTKEVDENSQTYRVYYIDAANKLNIYYIIIGVSYNEELEGLGFGNYFETQMISWMQNVVILSSNSRLQTNK